MTKDDENRLTMLEGVTSLLTGNRSKLTLGALLNAQERLEAVTLKIKEKVRETMTATSGKTLMKAGAEDALLGLLVPIAMALRAYGHIVGDQEIASKSKVTESELRYMRDTELVARARTIHELCVESLGEVGEYGISEAKLVSLKEKIDAFEGAIGERESSMARRKGARSSLYESFAEAMGILENQIDNLMEVYKASDTQFYNEYWEARVIKDIGQRHKVRLEEPAAQPTK